MRKPSTLIPALLLAAMAAAGPLRAQDCPAVDTFPYLADFDADNDDRLCWTIVDANGDGQPAADGKVYGAFNMRDGFFSDSIGGAAIYFLTSSFDVEVADDWLISPLLDFTDGQPRFASFQHIVGSAFESYETMSIWAIPDGGTHLDAQPLLPAADYTNYTWQTTVVDLAAYAGQRIRVGFHCESVTFNSYYLGINDFRVEDLPAASVEFDPPLLFAGSVELGAAPQASQFTLTAWNLAEALTVEAPANFQVSLDNSGFSGSISIPAASYSATPVYVAFAPAAVGYDTAYISISNSALQQSYTVVGHGYTCGDPLAAPFAEGFDLGYQPDCWTALDADGDGYTWEMMRDEEGTPSHSGAGFMATASAVNVDGHSYPLTPDNWLISPPIELRTNQAELRYWIAAQDAAWAAEHYGVFVSTAGADPADFELLFEETFTPARAATPWEERALDLGGYTGVIRLAFRHFDCTDQFRLNLDAISVTEPEPVSVGQAPEDGMRVYPNPAAGRLTVETPAAGSAVQIVDATGRVVRSGVAAGGDIVFDVNALPQGIYLVRISGPAGAWTRKIVKQ